MSKTPPWKQKPATKKPAQKLTAAEIKEASARAEAAGRRYPNLVDNLWILKQRKS